MIFINDKNEMIRIESVGYEFPDSNDKSYDSNWLNIKVSIETEKFSFQVTHPCLLTYDLKTISQWFSKIEIKENTQFSDLSFIEPNIEFLFISYLDNKFEFQIKLSFECNPNNNDEEFLVIYKKNHNECKLIASMCLEEYGKFPERK
ncbi:WapI family immunity protein [Leptospira brenneri]|uniref:WapI family immunity protein n=1 Tax=Leptospira brenneri TaxID=2023182 RepID=UPI000C2AE26A|nr:hypothetical protein [Leptospira brenneri]PJZ43777.1 hypothetical protein CH361_18670 [Leptospira brenneri]